MLSMNSRTSWPRSRKYSASVRPARPMRRRAPGGLVHLTVNQAGLVDNARLAHLEVQVGALTGTLANAGEHRSAAVLLCEVVDELLDKHRLTHAGAAEQAGLAAADIGLEQVDSLDAGLEDLSLCRELVKRRCGMVNRVVGVDLGHLLAVNRLAHDVPDATERALAHRHLHGGRRCQRPRARAGGRRWRSWQRSEQRRRAAGSRPQGWC